MAPKKATKPTTVTKDGLYISRRMRREADEAAAAEAAANAKEAEAAADAADLAAYEADPKVQAKSPAERTYDAERAQATATADARKKHKLA